MKKFNYILTSNDLLKYSYTSERQEYHNFIIYFARNDPLRGQDISTEDIIKLCRRFVYEI
jgi:hypothetical protein